MEECNPWIDPESSRPHFFLRERVNEGFNSWETFECQCQDQAKQPQNRKQGDLIDSIQKIWNNKIGTGRAFIIIQ